MAFFLLKQKVLQRLGVLGLRELGGVGEVFLQKRHQRRGLVLGPRQALRAFFGQLADAGRQVCGQLQILLAFAGCEQRGHRRPKGTTRRSCRQSLRVDGVVQAAVSVFGNQIVVAPKLQRPLRGAQPRVRQLHGQRLRRSWHKQYRGLQRLQVDLAAQHTGILWRLHRRIAAQQIQPTGSRLAVVVGAVRLLPLAVLIVVKADAAKAQVRRQRLTR